MEPKIKTLSFKLVTSDTQKKYLLDNMIFRHHLYNKGIECVRMKRHYNSKKEVTKDELTKFMYYSYEAGLPNRSYYATGISSVTADDLLKTINRMDTNGVEYKRLTQKFRYERFNSKYGSFGFETFVKSKDDDVNRVCAMTDNTITIKMTPKHAVKYYIGKHVTWFDDFTFDKNDIKKVFFVHNNGEFTITLAIDNLEGKRNVQ